MRSAVIILMALFWCIQSYAQTNTRPNVVVIYTDDHRYSAVHALSGQPVKTPNIDRLAKEGVVFTHTFLQGSFTGATCVPSRAMLLTGRGLFDLKEVGRQLPPEHKTIGEVFQGQGYNSYIVGKWHQDKASLARSLIPARPS